jgi:single-strand DNA-binding protein
MNKFIGIGRLCQDPEVRYTQNGKAVAGFSIAISRGFGDKEQTDFIPIVAWEKLAEICGNNLSKGRRVLVEGRLQFRTYDAQDGSKRRVGEIVAQNIEFLDSKQGGQAEKPPVDDASSFGNDVFPEEEIPF